LLERAIHKGLADIEGRWFEARALRLLNGEFQEEVAKSMVSDPGKFLKRRRGNSRVREQRKNRRDTLGIVPAEFVFPPWAGWL